MIRKYKRMEVVPGEIDGLKAEISKLHAKLKRLTKNVPFLTIRELLSDINPLAFLADGFETALIGFVDRFGQPTIALYDRDKCIEILMRGGKLSRQDAEEYFSFNVIGAGMGDQTPAFATILTPVIGRDGRAIRKESR